MHCKLGTFSLQPDPVIPDFMRAMRAVRFSHDALELALRETLLHRARVRECARRVPDILDNAPADRHWLAAIHGALEELREPCSVRLSHCEIDDGVTLAVVAETRRASVRANDAICAGLAARRQPDGGLEVLPRVYRTVCTNGAISYSHHGEDVLRECGGVREAVLACCAPGRLVLNAARLRRAAAFRVPDPRGLLASLELQIDVDDVLAAREEDDPTLYGLLNVLTAHARRESSFARRLEIERKAHDLLQHARLLRPAPARERATTTLV